MNETRAREILGINKDRPQEAHYEGGAICSDNSLSMLGHYMSWQPGDDNITLDSEFEVEELEAIIWWMKNK